MFQAGQQIGNYTLVKPLGRGGFGEVWLAERRAKFVTTKVAVKLPLRKLVDVEVIRQEAVLWEQASGHPNVMPIIEADEYDGQIVIVSEYAPNGTLEDLLIRETSLPVKKSVEMAIGILRGLEFLHSRNIIHRDIKPANILLQDDSPRLTDFGMSRAISENSMSIEIYGTPYYMAPEAFSRKRNVQTDIWSFGVILFKMLSGKLPFAGKNVPELYAALLNEEPRSLPPGIPIELQNIVAKSLEKLPKNRYATATEIREDLLNCLNIASDEKLPMDFYGNTDNNQDIHTTFEPSLLFLSESAELRIGNTNENAQHTESIRISQPKSKIFPTMRVLAAGMVLMFAVFVGGFLIFNNPEPVPFRKADKFGFSTWGKRLIIGAKYDFVLPFSQNLAVVAVGQKDSSGNFVGKYGFIDKFGRETVPLEYDYAESFSGNLAKVGRFDAAANKLKFGFINEKGELIISLNYEDALNFSNDLAAVKFQNKWGLIDKSGIPVIPFKYDLINSFSDGLASAKLGDKYGFIDKSGNEILPFVYEFAGKFSDGIAPVMKDGKAFFVDSKGKAAIRFKYNQADSFSEGLAMVTLNGKSGFIEKSGGEVIALQYENEKSFFSEGLACVKLKGKAGFINKGGQSAIPFIYNEAEPIHNNLARVKNADGKEFYIGFDGTEFYEP